MHCLPVGAARSRAGSSQTACSTPAYGGAVVGQGEPEQLEAAPGTAAAGRRRPSVRPARRTPAPPAGSRAARRAVSTTRPDRAVALLDLGQHLAAASGVAVGPVGQIQRVPAGEVEHLDVVGLQLAGDGGRASSPTRAAKWPAAFGARVGPAPPGPARPGRAARRRGSPGTSDAACQTTRSRLGGSRRPLMPDPACPTSPRWTTGTCPAGTARCRPSSAGSTRPRSSRRRRRSSPMSGAA